MRIIIRAYNKEGYSKDVVIASERQTHMTEGRVRGGYSGPAIYLADFPEIERFELVIERTMEEIIKDIRY